MKTFIPKATKIEFVYADEQGLEYLFLNHPLAWGAIVGIGWFILSGILVNMVK